MLPHVIIFFCIAIALHIVLPPLTGVYENLVLPLFLVSLLAYGEMRLGPILLLMVFALIAEAVLALSPGVLMFAFFVGGVCLLMILRHLFDIQPLRLDVMSFRRWCQTLTLDTLLFFSVMLVLFLLSSWVIGDAIPFDFFAGSFLDVRVIIELIILLVFFNVLFSFFERRHKEIG